MATVENFVVKVDTQGVEKLDRISTAAANASAKMNMLASSILGVSFGAFIASAINMADRVTDLADATNLSVGSILNFGNALEQAGGKSKNAEKIILTFFNAIDTALAGSDKARDSFAKLGVSLNDLKTLSEADLLTKSIEGLASMEAGAQRTALASDIFGKSMRAVDVEKFVQGLRDGSTSAEEAAKNLIAGGEAADKMAKQFQALQVGALAAIEPILKLLGGTEISANNAKTAFQILGAVMALSFGASMLANIIAVNRALGITAGLANLVGKSPLGIVARMAALGGATAIAAAELEKLSKANEQLEAGSRGKGFEDPRLIKGTGGGGGAARDAELSARDRARLESARRTSESMANIERDRALMTASELSAIRINADAEIARANLDFDQKETEQKISFAKERAAKIAEINQKAALDEAKYRRALDARIFKERMDQVEQDAKDMAAYYQQVDQDRIRASEQAMTIGRTNEELKGRLELQQKLLDMGTIEGDRAQKLFDLEQQRKEQVRQLEQLKNLPNDEREQREQRINELFKERIDLINQEADARLARENDFSAGMKESMKRYEESLTPLKRGAAVADSVFNNMGSALDNFVETGKLNFADFARSVIMDMLKIELRAAAMKMFQAAGGLSGIASLLGFAEGGVIQTNKPVLVGENGPELIAGAAGMTVTPNSRLMSGGGGGNTYVTNNISAVDAKSVAQLFAENRRTLLGNVRQAEKELPFRGR